MFWLHSFAPCGAHSPTFPLATQITALHEAITAHLADGRAGERLRSGVRVVISGPPDVGKSSLLNYFCREERAIVAAGPGTTRDVLSVDADLGGFPVVFVDTAGIRFGDDVGAVEREVGRRLGGSAEAFSFSPDFKMPFRFPFPHQPYISSSLLLPQGVRRAQAAAANADVRLCIQDGSRPDIAVCTSLGGGRSCEGCVEALASGQIVFPILNKSDLASPATLAAAVGQRAGSIWLGDGKPSPPSCADALDAQPTPNALAPPSLSVSCATSGGLDALATHLTAVVRDLCQRSASEGPAISRARHRAHLSACAGSLQRAEVR
jgi:tRNA modification GTPase